VSPATDRYREYVDSERYRSERPRKARVIARICGDELRRAGRIADLGSGTGIIKKELEDIFDKRLYGFDLDRSFMEVEERTAVADVTRLPVADGALDFAVLNHLYEHVDDQPGLFRELHRALAPGGGAYVSAGSRWAVMEPHYRLPFLSWLPRPLADLYLRVTGRGETYRGIRFLGHGRLTGMMRDAGFRVDDRTLGAVDDLLEDTWGHGWARVWNAVRAMPEAAVRALVRVFSPQWFFVLRKPADGAGADGRQRQGARR
jgi:SAM-dependent methyltransferase